MGNVNYNEWLNGKRCCGQNNIISIARNCHHNHACDCDNILLDISKLYTNDEILQDEIDAISGNSGITSGEVQTMIDESISGKVDTITFDAYTAYTANQLNGKATKSQIVSINNNLDNIAGELFRYENETDAALAQKASTGSVSTLETNVALFEARTAGQIGELSESTARALSGKQDTLIAGDNITISGNVISATGGGGGIDSGTVQSMIDGSISGKADSSAVTQEISAVVSDYYTKEEVNTIIAASEPSLSGYVTTSELIQYITNLQQQINSLIAEVSGCCGSTGETQYRWVIETGENDYWCSGTTKMSMEKEQSSNDGLTWTDTGNERSGSTVLETNCTNCGYEPVYGTKLIAHFNNGNTQTIMCNGEWEDGFIDRPDYNALETGASGLTSAEIGSCPTAIAGYGFSGCTNLSAVTIPNNVTSIGAWSFMGCRSLTAITIPSGVTSVNQCAFAYCSGLTSVTVEATTPPSAGGTLFLNGNANLVIYVPSASVNAYKTANGWSTYASKIQGI